MLGAEFMDEIDCGSFFDTMDDLIDFPADTDIGSGKVDDFPTIWSNPANGFPDSDPIFSGATSNAASDISAELSVPYEDIVQLEWLSNFVEDSFSGGGMTMNKENLPVKATAAVPVRNQFQTSSPVSVLESSSTTTSSSCNSTSWAGKTLPLIPGPRAPPKAQKARSKRPRPRTFNPRLISPASSLMDNPQPFPAPVTSSDSENVVESEPLKKLDAVATEPKKKKKIKFTMPSAAAAANVTMNQNPVPQGAAVRKCLHCEITKTPQWRAGPLGPKTLCNACGVRYKSGRLFPEYRPAASPTFVPAIHSNSHKKVIEMRTKGCDGNFLVGAMNAANNAEAGNEPELIPNSNPSLEYI